MITQKDIDFIIQYPHILGHIAGYKDLTSLHSEWFHYLFNKEKKPKSLQAHRGSYKSSMLDAIGSIMWSMFHPNDTIAIVRKNLTDSQAVIKSISTIMKLPEIKAIFEFLHGFVPTPTVDRANQLTFNYKTKITPEGNFNAYSIKSSAVGKHFDLIVFDDFVTIEDKMSKAERDRTIAMMEEYTNNVLNRNGLAIYIGTPWHKDDAWKICPEPKKYDCYSTGIMTEAQIIEKKQKTTSVTFAANYELRHVQSGDAIFINPHYKRWDYRYRSGIGAMDKAYFGGDTSAICFVCKKDDGRYQAIGWMHEDAISNHWEDIYKKWKKYYIGTIHTEDNDDKGYCSKELAQYGVPINTYHETKNKHVKILNHALENGFWNLIDWDYDTDPNFMAQISDYCEGADHDDCIDTVAVLGRILIDDDIIYDNRWNM